MAKKWKGQEMMRIFRRKIGPAGLLAVLVAVVRVAAAGTAQAVTLRPYGHVYNGDSPRCLDSGTPSGALLFNCSTSIYQQWRYTITGQIVGNSPTGCLDDGAGLNGSRVFLAPCNGSASQKWYGDPNGGAFTNGASFKCLDADLGPIGGHGTIVQVWSCSGAPNQFWWFEFVPS